MSECVIQATNVHRRFGRTKVLTGVDLCVPRGAVVGILGTNGAGKSTLIKCLLGLLRCDVGAVLTLGEDPWDFSATAKERLGYGPQEAKLYPWMKSGQIVDYTAAFYPNWDHRWAKELMTRWDVATDKRAGALSVGQLQKLSLVLALGHRPELLVLDEPVASLDPKARREFLRSLVDITEDERHTVLFSTHITSDLERIATHVAFLKDGVISFFGGLDELKEQVKRLRITATNDLPATFAVPGALRTEINGRTALVAVPQVSTPLLERLRHDWQAEVTVEDLNLEEIFLEFHNA
jgi:ABC-2 type transport system ATP-binding protein